MECVLVNVLVLVSLPVCRLIKRLLVREPKRRARIVDILTDPWLRSKLEPEELELGFARAAPLVRTQKLTDEESEVIVGTMVEGGIAASREEVEASLASDGYEHLAATYYLLAEKFLRDQRSRASGAPTPSLERAHGPNSTGVEQGSLRPTAAQQQQQQGSNKNSPTSPTDQNANLTARSPTEQSDEDSQQNFAPRRCSLIREESVTDDEPTPSRVNSAMLGKNKHKQASMLLMRESSLSISKEAADILANARAARDSVHLQQQDGSPDSMPSCDTSPMHHKQVNLNVDVNIDEAALDALVASHGCAVDAILEEGSSQEEMNEVPPQSATITPGDDQVFTVHAADENLSATTPAPVAETQAQVLPSSGHQSVRTTSAPIAHVQPQRKLGTATASAPRHRSSAQSASATLNLNLNVNLETGGRGSITPNSGSARPIALSKPRSHSLTRSPRGSMASSSGASGQHRLSAKLENTAGSVHSAGGGGGVGAKQSHSELLVVEGSEAGEPIHMHRSRSEGGVLLTTMGPATTRDASCPACGHTIAGRGLSGAHQISIGLSIRAHTPTRDEFLARSSTTPSAFPTLALRSSASPNVNASRANGSASGASEKEQQRPIVRAHALRLSLPASHGAPLLRPPTQAAAAADLLSRSASSSAFSCKSDSGVRYERSGTTSPALTPTSHINVIKPYEGIHSYEFLSISSQDNSARCLC